MIWSTCKHITFERCFFLAASCIRCKAGRMTAGSSLVVAVTWPRAKAMASGPSYSLKRVSRPVQCLSTDILNNRPTLPAFYASLSLFNATYSDNMFKKASDEDLLRRGVKDPGSGRLNKLRLLEGIPLRKINDSLSSHSSVQGHSQPSSIRSFASSAFSRDASLRSSLLIRAPSPTSKRPAAHQSTEQLLERHFTRGFTRSLVEYLNRDWSGVETKLVEDKKLQGYVSSVVQRSNWLKELLE